MRSTIISALTVSATAVSAVTYDYIVVGSGPGGGPLAADLARAGYSTLLIEAGGDDRTRLSMDGSECELQVAVILTLVALKMTTTTPILPAKLPTRASGDAD